MITFTEWRQIPLDFTGVCRLLKESSIRHYLDGNLHKEDGPAVVCDNGDAFFYYNHEYCGDAFSFSNKTWKEKVEEFKRKEQLKIFL